MKKIVAGFMVCVMALLAGCGAKNNTEENDKLSQTDKELMHK